MAIRIIDGLNRHLFRLVAAAYLGERPAVLLDAEGNSLIGELPERPAITSTIADRTYAVGGNAVTIDAATRFARATSYSLTPANLPGVTWDGRVMTIEPTTVIPPTTVTLRGINAGGTSEPLTFSLRVNAPTPELVAAIPDQQFVIGGAGVSIPLTDHFRGASTYAVAPTGQGVTIANGALVISAAQARDAAYTVTAANGTGQSVSDMFQLVVAAGVVVPEPQPGGIDSVVVIGASHEEAMFGRNLSTPDADATQQLAALGHNLPVYGWATGGARLVAARDHYNAARAAHPNALILAQFGGNNVSESRPYPGGVSTFNSGLAALLSVAQNDARFYPASLTFRDYDDTTFQNPDAGSRPYNEQLVIPWIAANFPHAIGAGGRPKVDLYRRVLAEFETLLEADNVHFTVPGYATLKAFYIARIADILSGTVPAEIPERVYEAPTTPQPVTYPALTRVAGTEGYAAGRFGQAMNSAGAFYARASASLTPTTPAWGVEAWIRIPTVSRSNIFWGEDGSAVYGLIRASGSSPAGRACISYAGATGTVHLSGGPRVDDNAWHHVAVQFRADGADLYVDGALAASSAVPIRADRTPVAPFTVGHYASTTAFIWSGQVDEVRIWDGVEITAPFTPRTEARSALPANTVAYWALDGNLTGGLVAQA